MSQIQVDRIAELEAENARLIAELDHLQRRGLAHSAVEVELLEKIARLRDGIDRHIELTGRDPIEQIVRLEDELVMASSSETFLRGEVARLREAIQAFHDSWLRYPNYVEEYEVAVQKLFEIAREGR